MTEEKKDAQTDESGVDECVCVFKVSFPQPNKQREEVNSDLGGAIICILIKQPLCVPSLHVIGSGPLGATPLLHASIEHITGYMLTCAHGE